MANSTRANSEPKHRKHKNIKLGARKLKVRYLHPSVTPDKQGSYEDAYSLITIREAPTAGPEADTLVHEILHALIDISGYRFTDTDDEEKFVLQITPWLHALIAQNPRLMQSLAARQAPRKGDR